MTLRRSLLFVPGNNERMLRKAISPELECDCAIFDLEDSVPLDQKDNARKLVRQVLAEFRHLEKSQKNKQICIRINQLESPFAKSDIRSLTNEEDVSDFVIPKAERKAIKSLFRLSGKHIIPMIESSKGFLQMEEIAGSKGVDALAYGAADMALSMRGSVENYQNNEYIRTRIAIVSKAYGIDPIDQVFFDLNNIDGFRRDASKAKNLGYAGKLLIHPSQIPIANEVFSRWTNEEINWAKQVIHAYEDSVKGQAKGAIRLNGQLIDAVHYKLAKDIISKIEA